jgi:hypothetical protein
MEKTREFLIGEWRVNVGVMTAGGFSRRDA